MKKVIRSLLVMGMVCSLTGCQWLGSKINEFTGSLIGNQYTITTYDNYGQKVMTTTGSKINISGNSVITTGRDTDGNTIESTDLTAVLTIDIDGKQIQSCGDTLIFEQKGLNAEVNFLEEEINSSSGLGGLTSVSAIVNHYRNMFGKSRVVVVKSQLGQPIVAYSGDKVYWEIPDDLPKMTKLMIDGKALYIHRANFQIIDKDLLEE